MKAYMARWGKVRETDVDKIEEKSVREWVECDVEVVNG